MAGKITPVMRQHAEAKAAYPDAVLFFRLGDFYEMFGEDAVLCARVLNLTLTSRNRGKPDEIPMAGVPHHAAHAYIGRMLEAGYQVAICEQMADPKTVKGIVPRDVVRVLTPGLITAEEHLAAQRNNWLAALWLNEKEVGIALLDLSTGELRAAELSDLAGVLAELAHAAPAEVLIASVEEEALSTTVDSVQAIVGPRGVRAAEELDEAQQMVALGQLAKDAERLGTSARGAVAAALHFARACNPKVELPVRSIGSWDPSRNLVIDPTAQLHLELVESLSGDASATLLGVVDRTCSPPGARLLRQRLLSPLLDVAQIRRRLDVVDLFVVHAGVRKNVRDALGALRDPQRVVTRVMLGEASPRDLGGLRDGLHAGAQVVELMASLQQPLELEARAFSCDQQRTGLDTVADLAALLQRALVERPPAAAKEGAVFKAGFDRKLSKLEKVRKDSAGLIAELEAELREQTEITGLKVKYTRVFGWYIEVSKSGLSKVPKTWRRKQTVANAERYTLEQLDDLADEIAGAEEAHRARELELLRELNQSVREAADRIRALVAGLAEWDVAATLAEVAHQHDYCRPEVNEGRRLEIEDGRHPVVERLAAAGKFVPNSSVLDADGCRCWLITGPNMAGKSTFLRQVALCTIMAQMGSFVPASSARIGVVDRVLSRVGASDNLAQGESTFMVEMRETADILRFATTRSLVILDEIGRGTSTFDGLSIAWAVAEHLSEVSRCRVLFATHYHELTALAEESEALDNFSVSAREREGEIVFLHRLVHGAASRSYGVAVAQLAGLPEGVLARARALLAGLEGERLDNERAGIRPGRSRKQAAGQLGLFAAPEESLPHQGVLDSLRAANVERMTPIDALQLLVKLKRQL